MSAGPSAVQQQRREAVQCLLERMDGLDPLKQLFWTELNYNRVNQPVARGRWAKAAREALADDPILFAEHAGLHVFYGRLHSSGRLHLSDERAVVTQLLRDHPYALFVFSDAEQRHWHFVNVKYDPVAEQIRERRRLFRRISVGPDERLRTAAERIEMLNTESTGELFADLSALALQHRHDEAFDVEKVTREFYSRYEKVFKALRDHLRAQLDDSAWAHDSALQFLSRVMFVYFVQRKRWLGDDSEFMHAFWEAYKSAKRPKDTFVAEWLSVLFFEAFNNRFQAGRAEYRDRFPDHLRTAFAAAPYLNGGLFEPNDLDSRFTPEIPDQLFFDAYSFFESYNFTIAEDSPLDQEVAVDPEMIGKVYESLVNVHDEDDESGQWGIFYTPRTEIDLMCRLALVDHLSNHLGQEHRPLLYEVVFAFEKQEKEEADARAARENLWPDLSRRLQEITVLDPACGSGSFLVGMLHLLTDLRTRADHALGTARQDVQYRYELTKEIIGQSLYGVDIKEWAVRVAELRLWLQLVVEAELDLELRKFRPLLPNLSLKLRPGDSLVQEVGGLDLSHLHGRGGLDRQVKGRITRLKAEKLRFFRSDDRHFSKSQIDQEERLLFRDIVLAREKALSEEAKRLRTRIEHPEKQLGLEIDAPKSKKASQLELDIEEDRRKLEQAESSLEELHGVRQALASTKVTPFVWDIAFVEVMEGDAPGFDIVVGNPPYVRQERIAPPPSPGQEARETTLEERRAYKAKLMQSVYALYPRFFGYRPAMGQAARKLDAKNDLYTYFYFHGLHLLNPKGSFCFITSNSWLDVGYGKDLQEFLLRHGHVKLILDNQVRRSFSTADVNTVIALLARPDDREEEGLARTARFVMCRVPFEQMLSPVPFLEIEEATSRKSLPEFRVHPRPQRELLSEGIRAEAAEGTRPSRPRYEANKWGGKYLRAPDVYWRILEEAGDRLVRLGDVAEVRRGFTTGANDFFYVKVLEVKDGVARIVCDDGSEHLIETEYVREPVIVKAREIVRPNVGVSDTRYRLVRISGKPKRHAARYIRWGESSRRDENDREVGQFNRRPTTSGRAAWYEAPTQPQAFAALPMAHKRRPVVALLGKARIFLDNRLYAIYTREGASVGLLGPSLCSTFGTFIREIMGRANFGQGMLDLKVYEASQLDVLDEASVSSPLAKRLMAACGAVARRKILMLYDDVRQPDRIALDDAFLEAVGFDDRAERAALVKELQDAACRMIWNRMAKTDNARESRMSYDEWLATDGPFGEVPDEDDAGDEE